MEEFTTQDLSELLNYLVTQKGLKLKAIADEIGATPNELSIASGAAGRSNIKNLKRFYPAIFKHYDHLLKDFKHGAKIPIVIYDTRSDKQLLQDIERKVEHLETIEQKIDLLMKTFAAMQRKERELDDEFAKNWELYQKLIGKDSL